MAKLNVFLSFLCVKVRNFSHCVKWQYLTVPDLTKTLNSLDTGLAIVSVTEVFHIKIIHFD